MLSSAYNPAHRATPTDRATQMPLLGFLTGLSLALVLWTAAGWLVWLLLG